MRHLVPGKRIEPVTEETYIRSNFFDMWLQEHPDVELVEVPADLVMASGSGLDPHITLKIAQYQLDRVVDAWAEKTKADKSEISKTIEELLNQKAEAPFGGLAGVKLINVLEVNLALPDVMKELPEWVPPSNLLGLSLHFFQATHLGERSEHFFRECMLPKLPERWWEQEGEAPCSRL